ncbi:tRNA uridine-5-carboxymethylaminomethyl(34) synthesis GTPase MnmE [Pseudoxanthomonas kalamensis DSM 18571]|nr:tRNA uridine-5-carboxymethylaminomethyl(34) synthesis GTPase MnmE [Pseudoxanthomonas kalamensis]KAF1712334.1 tRNA uridine-5-carboxymethylaminomethyl(34) synthesis GTPase MnmE [Pseudoxanthomonas kalamensis DSM 18571]
MQDNDTIVAIATAAGSGGVGIVRVSGPQSAAIGENLCGRRLRARYAHYTRFRDATGETIDDGIALYFPAPHSFTGEDVVELQAHGSPVVLQQLVARACALGVRQARPGEFSERAFLNGRLDLAQAEAIADLIAATDARAARAARRSLEGVFSTRVQALAETLVHLRVQIEATIDFADEPLDTLGIGTLRCQLQEAGEALVRLREDAERGRKLRDGAHVVIAGPPNAGKSSLLNALSGRDRAIVTDVAGTTRDTLHETIRMDGVELTLVDTAGLRESGDVIEREGMRRARDELARADLVLLVQDASGAEPDPTAILPGLDPSVPVLSVCNKADLLDRLPPDGPDRIHVSARTGLGLERLQLQLRRRVADDVGRQGGGEFSARSRHVESLRQTERHVETAKRELDHEYLELAAEELRQAHDALGEITGKVSPDELLGRIFSTFCIGK